MPNPELTAEADALETFAGRGAVRLLRRATEEGALLLERAVPGRPAVPSGDHEPALRAVAGVMRTVDRPAPAGSFRTVADWFRGFARLRRAFGGGTGPFPEHLVTRAERVSADLIATATEVRLLHGDLHFENVLSATREPWLAIDPKGVLGEPAYEAGAVFRNPLPELLASPDPSAALKARLRVVCDETGLPRERVAGWAFAQAVLSGWWFYEDFGGGWQPSFACAGFLAKMC